MKKLEDLDKCRFVLFSTFRDEEGYELVDAICKYNREGYIRGEIPYIFSNRPLNEIREEYRDRYPPIISVPSKEFKPELWHKNREEWRTEYDREVMKALEKYGCDFDVGVLVGYMLIVGPEMCKAFDLINLHPAPPGGPKGKWEDVINELVESKRKNPERTVRAGAQIHLVTEELDSGPALTYFDFEVGEGDSFEEVRAYELAREFPLLLITLKKFGDGELKIRREGTERIVPPPLSLNRKVEEWVKCERGY